MATEPTESTDPLTTFLCLATRPPHGRSVDAGLLPRNTGERGRGITRVGVVGRVFRGFRGQPGVERKGPHYRSIVYPKFSEEPKSPQDRYLRA